MATIVPTSGDVAPDPTKDRAFNVLSGECNGAELVSAVIKYQPVTGATRYLNGWSCLRLLPEAEALATTYLTSVPQSLPMVLQGRAQLIVSRSTMTVQEARALLPIGDHFVDPRVAGAINVEAQGEWLAGRVVGIDDADLRSLLPSLPQTLHAYEKRAPGAFLGGLLGESGLMKLCVMVNETLGVNLERHPHRVGEFLLAVPCVWPEVACRTGSRRQRMGIEIRATRPLESSCTVVLTELDGDRHERSQCWPLQDGLHVLDTHPDLSSYELRVYGPDGLLRHLERYALFRQMRTELQFHRASGEVSLQIGAKTVAASYSWASPLVQTIGDPPPSSRDAERQAVAAREEQAKLDSGHVVVFAGGKAERTRALDAMRTMINAARSRVWIVDPYFGRGDVVEFVTALASPEIELRILVSGEPTRDDVRRGLADLNAKLAEDGAAQLTKCEVRVASGPALHDRFIALDAKWWQLGTSLNNLGDSMSAITAFSAPLLMESLFQTKWQSSR